jgi:hypothetical protein
MLGMIINIGALALIVWAFAYVARRMFRSSRGKCGSCGGCSGCGGDCASCRGQCGGAPKK